MFVLVFVATGVGQSQQRPQPPKSTSQVPCSDPSYWVSLAEVAEQWKEGYNSGDAGKVAGLYTADAYYFTQHYAKGVLHGRAEIRAYVQGGIDARYRIDSIKLFSMECSGELAYAVGRYDSTNAGEKAFGHNIIVLKTIAGKWLIVAHESAVPEATAIRVLSRDGREGSRGTGYKVSSMKTTPGKGLSL